MLLDPGYELTLRPMKYPDFFDMYKNAIKNTWTVEEVDFNSDLVDLHSNKITKAERFLIQRLVAFFATGDSIVSNNLVLNYYKHINSPEARLYLSRQLYEEALHVQFYLTLLDTYIPDEKERAEAFSAINNIATIKAKGDFAFKWINFIQTIDELKTLEDRRKFLLNIICFATCIEGLFFFGSFAYVYFLRSKGLLNGLATGTNWVFRDESCHMNFAFKVIETVRAEEPDLWQAEFEDIIRTMLAEAIDCEMNFATEFLSKGIVGLSQKDMRTYLEFVADQHFLRLRMKKVYNVKNPFDFMELQNTQELANFFERKVSAYQVGVSGNIGFDHNF